MNVDQIYSCLLKLKLNFCIGPSSNYKQTLYMVTKYMLSLYLGKSSFIYWKKQPLPHQKTKWSSCPLKKSNLESIPLYLSTRYSNRILRMASYFELYIMSSIKIIMYCLFRDQGLSIYREFLSLAKPDLCMYNVKY